MPSDFMLQSLKRWTNLREAIERLDEVKSKPGVYILRWASREQGIARLDGIDYKSILYIGSTANLGGRRIRDLWKKLSKPENKAKHTMIDTMIFCSLTNKIRPEDLEIMCMTFQDKNQAEQQEWALLRFYSEKYGEPPPLNLFMGRKKFLILGLGELGRSKLAPHLNRELIFLVFQENTT